MDKNNKETKLAKKRKEKGYSQYQLHYISGINVWTIRDYEQRRREIDKAEAWKVKALADALDCKMEELLERVYKSKKRY